jgi:hypothetical protein
MPREAAPHAHGASVDRWCRLMAGRDSQSGRDLRQCAAGATAPHSRRRVCEPPAPRFSEIPPQRSRTSP